MSEGCVDRGCVVEGNCVVEAKLREVIETFCAVNADCVAEG